MKVSDFISNKRFTTAFIDGWLYEKKDGDIIKIKPYGKGAGAFIFSDDNQWKPYEYTHFKDIVEYFNPHPNDYFFYDNQHNGQFIVDVPLETIFTDHAEDLIDFILILDEEMCRKYKDDVILMQQYYSYKAIIELIPASILYRIQTLPEMQWEMLQLFNQYSKSIALYDKNPAIMFLIAAVKYFYTTEDHIKSANLLIHMEENTLLKLLGFDNSKTALKIFEKINPSFYTVKSFLSLRDILESKNEKVIDFLLEADELEGELIGCCSNGTLLPLLEEIYYQCGIHTPDYYDSLDKIIRYRKQSYIMSFRYGYNCKPYDEITTIKELNDAQAQAEIYYEYEKKIAGNKQASPNYFMLRPAATIYYLISGDSKDIKDRLSKNSVNIIEYIPGGKEQNTITIAVSYDQNEKQWNILDYNAGKTVIESQRLFNEFQEWFYSE